ncbi:hypothetical protein ACGFMM_31160 [Streptomyces sp. NPDC048604]|uniref:hypothetical protein n=1 Tax=Streptomyces sp. NPDC048604 TaxID=3365578 RepID=UPI00371C0B12
MSDSLHEPWPRGIAFNASAPSDVLIRRQAEPLVELQLCALLVGDPGHADTMRADVRRAVGTRRRLGDIELADDLVRNCLAHESPRDLPSRP